MLPAFHAITGCDQSSYFMRKRKSEIFENALKTGSIGLLESLRNRAPLTTENSVDVQELVRTVILWW